PASISQSKPAERVIREEQRQPLRLVQKRLALVIRRHLQAEQIQDRRRRVNQARRARDMHRRMYQCRCRDYEWHSHVFVVNEKSVGIIPFVLSERFAVIAKNHEKRIRVQPALLESFEQLSQGSVREVKRVAIAIDLRVAAKGPRSRRIVRMMASDG